MLIPSTRPFFKDAEFYNGNADSALTARRLVQWANYTYYRHLRSTPFDPGNAGLNFDLAGARLKGYSAIGTLGTTSGGSYVPTEFGTIVVPPSHGPHTHITVRCNIQLYSQSHTVAGFIRLVSSRGLTYDIPYNSGMSASWFLGYGDAFNVEKRIPAQPGDVFYVTGWQTAGGVGDNAWLNHLGAWWDETGLTTYPWATMAQSFHAGSQMPDATYLMRWFGRYANTFAVQYAPIIANKWYARWKNDGTEGDGTLGWYPIRVPPLTKQLTVRFLARRTTANATSLSVFVPGTTEVTQVVNIDGAGLSPTTYCWYSVTFNYAMSYVPQEFVVVLTPVDYAGGARMRLATVQVYETGVRGLTFAGAESAPAFTDVDDAALQLGSTIATAHRSTLVGNMLRCWLSSGIRWYVDDCRWDEILADGDSVAGTDNPDPLYTSYPNVYSPTRRGNASAVHRFQAGVSGTGARLAYTMLERPHASPSFPSAPVYVLNMHSIASGGQYATKTVQLPEAEGGPPLGVDFGRLNSTLVDTEVYFEQTLIKIGADQGNPDRFMVRSHGCSLYEVPQR